MIAQNEAHGRNQSPQHLAKAAILRSQLFRLHSVSTSNSRWLACHFLELTESSLRYHPHFANLESYGSPVFAPNQPLWTRNAPSMKILQTALRNTFFRMRRDDSTPKNSCQAKNAPLQSSQYGHSERIGEAFPVFIMLASPLPRARRKVRSNFPGRT